MIQKLDLNLGSSPWHVPPSEGFRFYFSQSLGDSFAIVYSYISPGT